jgi:hypothetical protein
MATKIKRIRRFRYAISKRSGRATAATETGGGEGGRRHGESHLGRNGPAG